MIFLTHVSYPAWTVCTTDHKTAQRLILKLLIPKLQNRQQRLNRGKSRAFMILAFILVLCAASLYGLFVLKEPLVKALAKRIPPAWEQKLGEAAFLQDKSGKRICG